ncbi:MAG TPA: sel1 repeat family protein [Rhodanobacter sp.]|nr:sel1 repeat family protein [Rhodanobacter sp.]
MKALRQQLICVAACGLLAATAVASAGEKPARPLQDKASQEVLQAMSLSSTWGHPDEYGEFTGMQHFAAGNFKAAMKYFLIGARYADKLSQLSIGLMYLNGQGVKKDPVEAFAWVAMAAERKYPQFLATRDAIWAQLDAQQREQAKAQLEKLYPEYGDTTAKHRMALMLRWNRTQLTGSYLGFGSDSVSSLTPEQFNGEGARPPCGAKTIDGAAITGCGNIYASWRWDPKEYFQARDREWQGTVSVGTMVQADGPMPKPKTPDKQQDMQ